MAVTSVETIKNWFKTGLKPTQAQFWAWMDSFWHKNDSIPAGNITGLGELINNFTEITFQVAAGATHELSDSLPDEQLTIDYTAMRGQMIQMGTLRIVPGKELHEINVTGDDVGIEITDSLSFRNTTNQTISVKMKYINNLLTNNNLKK